MYKHLEGKTLLVMDRTALAACAVERAKKMGIKTVVANFYKTEESPSKQIADIALETDISDIDAMLSIIHDYKIDGVFVGWTDSHLPFYARICEKAGLPCCGTLEQFEVLSNNKRRFTEECVKYGVPTPKQYNINIDFQKEDLEKIIYPVMVKPADESGGRGIMKCNCEEELKAHYKELYDKSKSKKIVCEQYMDGEEIFIHYTVQDGYCSLSSAFRKYKLESETETAASCLFHMFTPEGIEQYKQNEEKSVVRMIKGLGIKYGNVMFQGFVNHNRFFFHESGLRMGGEQFYIFSEQLNNISSLELMIEFAITGKMTLYDVKNLDDYRYKKYCCNYYIPLKAGIIDKINGIDELECMPQVLQIKQFKYEGDTIASTTSLDRVAFRLHVMDDTKESFARTLCDISSKLRILDINSDEMQMKKLDYNYVMRIIDKAWPEGII